MKNVSAKKIMLLLTNINYLKGENSLKFSHPKKSSMLSPEHASYKNRKKKLVNIHTDSQYAFGVIYNLEEEKKKMFSYVHRDPNKNGWVNVLTTILSPSEIVKTKIEAHTKNTEPEYQGKSLVNFQAKARITESIGAVVHVDKVHSVSTKMTPFCQTLAILLSLQHSNCLFLSQRSHDGQNGGKLNK